MGTVPTKPKDESEHQAEALLRSAIAGHPRGAVRRIVLWVVAVTALVIALFALPAPLPPLFAVAFIIGFLALLLLLLTDGLV